MSNTDDKSRKALTVTQARAAYDVGYARPPEATRFQKGVSGNPRGRPKGAKNKPPRLNEERMKDIIIEEAYRTITVRDGEHTITVPIAQAVVRALGVKAMKGDHRSQRLFAELLCQTESANKLLHDQWLDTALTYKIEWEKELRRRAELGIEGPEPLPHPDHIRIDMNTGDVRVIGPMTREAKVRYDELAQKKDELVQELAALRQEIVDDPELENCQVFKDEILHVQNLLDIISRAVPD